MFDDIHGTISFGTKSFNFSGNACNKLFSFGYQISLNEKIDNAKTTMSLCLNQWEGVSLRSLPYFDKVLSLFSKIAQGWEVFISLEINGIEAFSFGVGMKVNKWDYILDISSFLNYINRCRIISAVLQHEIKYTSNISYTSEEHKYIADIVEVIEGKQIYDKNNITSNVICNLIVDDESKNVSMLTKLNEPTSIRMVQEAREKIKLFGIEVDLPSKIICLNSVLPKIHGKIDKLQKGDIIEIEWIPQKDFKYVVSYEL